MIRRTARYDSGSPYLLSGPITNETRHLWLVFHGYGQLARDFISSCATAHPEDTCVIAPQGLSLFYLRGHTGAVGASWLTSEDRRIGIDNQLRYLDAMYNQEISTLKQAPAVYLLGFSQGAATASRWAANSSLSFDGLVLWGGYPDHEITARLADRRLSGPRILVAHGSDDHLVTPDELSSLKAFMASRRIEAEYWQYDGGHAVDPKQFQEMEQKIRGVSLKTEDKS